ncbi:extracellular solute-binding protein, partial [Carnobacterium sp.]|uniref:extracellular solute-binding protein n=1 Tax=Carnobacterium sp. TaxID=48221 RepID=UPI0028B2302C
MKTKKRFWTTVALTVSSVFLLAGCGGNNETANEKSSTKSGDGPVELEFWSFWGSGPRNEAVEKIISDFNEKQDDIVVKHVFQPWGDIWTKSLASVAAGNPPDVIIQDINSVRQRADANQAIDLQEYIDKEDEDIKGRFYPQLLDAATFEDDVYGLPFNTDTQVLFYNKDLFEKAGLDPETPPATWADLEKDAAALEEKDGDKWKTIGFYPLWSTGPDVWALNADNGVSWFDDKDNVKINTPDKVDSLQWILDWQKHIGKSTVDSYEAEFGAGIADPFVSELVAMRGQNINYLVELNELDHDINFGVALLPEKTEGSGHYSWG